MEYIDHIKRWKPELQEIIFKMIMGINVEITKEHRDSSKYFDDTGKWFFITSINSDESITIQNDRHQIFSGLNYKDLKLRSK